MHLSRSGRKRTWLPVYISDISQKKRRRNDQVERIDDRSLSVNRYRYTRTWICVISEHYGDSSDRQPGCAPATTLAPVNEKDYITKFRLHSYGGIIVPITIDL